MCCCYCGEKTEIVKDGMTGKGHPVQRYKCKICGKNFTTTTKNFLLNNERLISQNEIDKKSQLLWKMVNMAMLAELDSLTYEHWGW